MMSCYLKNSNSGKCIFSGNTFPRYWCDFWGLSLWDREGLFVLNFIKFINIFVLSWTASILNLPQGLEKKHSTMLSSSLPYFHLLHIQLFNSSWNYLRVMWGKIKWSSPFLIVNHSYQHDLLCNMLFVLIYYSILTLNSLFCLWSSYCIKSGSLLQN